MKTRKNNSVIERKFKILLNSTIVINILVFIIGLILTIWPNGSNKLIGTLLGILCIVSGINTFVKFIKRDGAKLYSLNIFFGIIMTILGLILIAYPYTIINFITVCLAVYFILYGALKINYALWFKMGEEETWIITLVTAISFLTLGVLMLINPFSGLKVTQVVGVFLMLYALLDIANTYMFKKRASNIMKIFW